jgi:hypothetical protein
MKIPKKYELGVFAFLMSILMSGIMSFFVTLLNIGIREDVFIRWISAWGASFFIAFPIAFFVTPVVRKLVHKFVEQ